MFQTVLDPNEVFFPQIFQNNRTAPYKKLENGVVFGVECKEGFRVQSIFSTNPADYLNPKYQYGKYL